MGKSYVLLNLIKKQDDDDYSIIDNIYLYEVDPNVAKKKYPTKKHGKNNLENLKNWNALFENFSSVISASIGISPPNFFTIGFNSFARLLSKFLVPSPNC